MDTTLSLVSEEVEAYLNGTSMHFICCIKIARGSIAQTDSANNLIIYRTNIGDSRYQRNWVLPAGRFCIREEVLFIRIYIHFLHGCQISERHNSSSSDNISVDGNKVESVPEIISRNGLTFKYSKFSLSALYSYTAGQRPSRWWSAETHDCPMRERHVGRNSYRWWLFCLTEEFFVMDFARIHQTRCLICHCTPPVLIGC